MQPYRVIDIKCRQSCLSTFNAGNPAFLPAFLEAGPPSFSKELKGFKSHFYFLTRTGSIELFDHWIPVAGGSFDLAEGVVCPPVSAAQGGHGHFRLRAQLPHVAGLILLRYEGCRDLKRHVQLLGICLPMPSKVSPPPPPSFITCLYIYSNSTHSHLSLQ